MQAVLDARRPKPPAKADLDTLIREFEAGDPHYSQPATLKKIAALGESTPQLVQKLAILISDRTVGKEAARVLIGLEAAGYPAISKLVAHISAMPEPRLDETQASFLATRAKQAESAIPLLSKLSASAKWTTARRAFVTLTAIAEFHPDAQAQVDELMRTSGVKAAMQAQPSAIRDAIVQAENGEPANLIACLNRAETADLALVELERFIARDLGVLYKVILTANDLEQVARLVISAGDEGVQALLLCLDARTAAIGKRAEALALVGAQTPWIRPLLEDYARHYLRAPLRPPFEHAISQTPIPSPEQLAATAELAQRVRIVWHIWALTLDHSHPMDAELVKAAINGTSQRERVRALWAVQRLDAAATKPFVPVIVRAARDCSWALDALLNVARKLGTPLAQLAPEIWAMRVSGTDAQRARIALTLAHEYPLTIARAGICYAALRDPQPKIRQAALTEAGKLPPRERLDLILSTGGIEDSSLRMRAADMFRGIPRELLIPRREEVDRWFDILRPHPVRRDPARALTARVYLHIGKTGFDRVETFLQEELQAERDTRDTKSRRPRNRRNLLRDIAELAADGRPLAPTIFAFARSEDQATRKSAFRALAAMQLQDDPMLAAAWLGLVRTQLTDQAQWDAFHTATILEVLPNLGHGAAFAIETVLTLKGVPAQEADPSHSKRFRALVALGATDAQITSYLKHVLGRMTQSNRLLATEICALGDRATMLFPLLKSSMQHKVWMRGWCAEILRELTPKLTV
ncbi:MAG: hypothetical protein GY944_08340, partial [bacterium]|nr:hypothetical protein [bacterium]